MFVWIFWPASNTMSIKQAKSELVRYLSNFFRPEIYLSTQLAVTHHLTENLISFLLTYYIKILLIHFFGISQMLKYDAKISQRKIPSTQTGPFCLASNFQHFKIILNLGNFTSYSQCFSLFTQFRMALVVVRDHQDQDKTLLQFLQKPEVIAFD